MDVYSKHHGALNVIMITRIKQFWKFRIQLGLQFPTKTATCNPGRDILELWQHFRKILIHNK